MVRRTRVVKKFVEKRKVKPAEEYEPKNMDQLKNLLKETNLNTGGSGSGIKKFETNKDRKDLRKRKKIYISI
jgi:hypothetical protein